MPSPLKVVHVASEVHPFTKTGGLADVARSLPKALARLGHSVTVITPLYGSLDYHEHGLKLVEPELVVTLPDATKLAVRVWQGQLLANLPVYLLAQDEFFGSQRGIYGDRYDNQRFFVFNLAVLETLLRLKLVPNVIHCHDWQAGLIPQLVASTYREAWPRLKTLFTIHNLSFQFGHDWWGVPGELRDNGRNSLPSWDDRAAWERVNFAKRAILAADIITTVSEQYAQEIVTKNFGQDLHRILLHRQTRLLGIVNGLDYKDYNPATDPGLVARYDIASIDRKYENKRYVQRMFGLPEQARVPLIGMVTRLSEQKGFDLLLDILEPLLRLDIQLVVMGGGDKSYADALRRSAKRHSRKFAVHLEFDTVRATQVYAGSDIFLMPSRFEPCGLGQMISLRYGSIPIVHATGGLVDTIRDYNPLTGKGNGFVFKSYDSRDFLVAITRAVVNFKYQLAWRKLVEEGMKQSFTWQVPAQQYVSLYRRLLRQPKV